MKRSKKVSKTAVNKKVKKLSASKPARLPVKEDVLKLVHLLQVSQVELEHQNQELRIAEQELEASRNKYVNLFDFSPIPYFSLNISGIIKEVNLSAGKMLGLDRSKLMGKNIHAFIPFEERNVFDGFIATVFESSEKQSCSLRLENKDKRVFHVLLEGVKSVETPESDRTCQVALIDLTDQKKLEDVIGELSKGRK